MPGLIGQWLLSKLACVGTVGLCFLLEFPCALTQGKPGSLQSGPPAARGEGPPLGVRDLDVTTSSGTPHLCNSDAR